jgi:hypothetical protein
LAGKYLWDWFWDLHNGRTYGLAGNPITYTDMASWASLVGAEPSHSDIRAIKAMDTAFINAQAKQEQ